MLNVKVSTTGVINGFNVYHEGTIVLQEVEVVVDEIARLNHSRGTVGS